MQSEICIWSLLKITITTSILYFDAYNYNDQFQQQLPSCVDSYNQVVHCCI